MWVFYKISLKGFKRGVIRAEYADANRVASVSPLFFLEGRAWDQGYYHSDTCHPQDVVMITASNPWAAYIHHILLNLKVVVLYCVTVFYIPLI